MGRLPRVGLDEAGAAYLQACAVGGNVSRWRHQQGVIVAAFSRYLERQGISTLQNAMPHHLTGFLAELQGRGLSRTTMHRQGTVIRAWARWTVESGLLTRAPIAGAKLRTPEPAPLELPAFSEIMAAILAGWNREHREALLVLLGTGLRRGELLALRWADCDLAAGILEVRPHADGWSPKSGKARAVGMPAWVTEVLAGRKVQKGGAGPFQDDKGAPIFHESTISHAWLRMTRARGLNVRLHDLRHAHASEALKRGATVLELQAQLGHASITTTQRYLHTDRKSPLRVAAVMEGVMPGRQAAR